MSNDKSKMENGIYLKTFAHLLIYVLHSGLSTQDSGLRTQDYNFSKSFTTCSGFHSFPR